MFFVFILVLRRLILLPFLLFPCLLVSGKLLQTAERRKVLNKSIALGQFLDTEWDHSKPTRESRATSAPGTTVLRGANLAWNGQANASRMSCRPDCDQPFLAGSEVPPVVNWKAFWKHFFYLLHTVGGVVPSSYLREGTWRLVNGIVMVNSPLVFFVWENFERKRICIVEGQYSSVLPLGLQIWRWSGATWKSSCQHSHPAMDVSWCTPFISREACLRFQWLFVIFLTWKCQCLDGTQAILKRKLISIG